MFLKCSQMGADSLQGQSEETKYQLMNEIMEMHRFIVEKYAGFNSLSSDGSSTDSISLVCKQAMFLHSVWTELTSTLLELSHQADDEQDTREQSITLQSIIRIMSQILAKMPFRDMPKESVHRVVTIAYQQILTASQYVQNDPLVHDYFQAYLTCFARVLLAFKMEGLDNGLPVDHQSKLQECLKVVVDSLEIGIEEIDYPFIVMEDISLLCLLTDENLFFSDIVFDGQTSYLVQKLFQPFVDEGDVSH